MDNEKFAIALLEKLESIAQASSVNEKFAAELIEKLNGIGQALGFICLCLALTIIYHVVIYFLGK